MREGGHVFEVDDLDGYLVLLGMIPPASSGTCSVCGHL